MKFHHKLLCLAVLVASLFQLGRAEDDEDPKPRNKTNHPEQLHLSLGVDESEMLATWSTDFSIPDHAQVEFGLQKSELKSFVQAETTHFNESKSGVNIFMYRAMMTGLKPNTVYYYRVGSKGSAWSQVYDFKTFPHGEKWNPRLAIYGDLGLQNEVSLPYLSKDVEKNMYDAIFHVGDIAYNLHEEHGERGNLFMMSIEKVAARVPYMTLPGNHEHFQNFSHFDARFSMLGDRAKPNRQAPLTQRLNNHFHSMDIGPLHIIAFSTEFYYFTEFGWEQIERQYRFLEEDLKRANANRAQRPWVIVLGHRPMMCLNWIDSSCNGTLERKAIRQGIHMHDNSSLPLQYGLEDLFYKYGVDLQFYGHEHYYGRLLPLYNNEIKTDNSSINNPYENAHAPVQITTGSAGNREWHPPVNPLTKKTKWVAKHAYDFGYTRLTVVDRQHIVLEQISDDKHGEIIDRIDLKKHTDHPKWMTL